MSNLSTSKVSKWTRKALASIFVESNDVGGIFFQKTDLVTIINSVLDTTSVAIDEQVLTAAISNKGITDFSQELNLLGVGYEGDDILQYYVSHELYDKRFANDGGKKRISAVGRFKAGDDVTLTLEKIHSGSTRNMFSINPDVRDGLIKELKKYHDKQKKKKKKEKEDTAAAKKRQLEEEQQRQEKEAEEERTAKKQRVLLSSEERWSLMHDIERNLNSAKLEMNNIVDNPAADPDEIYAAQTLVEKLEQEIITMRADHVNNMSAARALIDLQAEAIAFSTEDTPLPQNPIDFDDSNPTTNDTTPKKLDPDFDDGSNLLHYHIRGNAGLLKIHPGQSITYDDLVNGLSSGGEEEVKLLKEAKSRYHRERSLV